MKISKIVSLCLCVCLPLLLVLPLYAQEKEDNEEDKSEKKIRLLLSAGATISNVFNGQNVPDKFTGWFTGRFGADYALNQSLNVVAEIGYEKYGVALYEGSLNYHYLVLPVNLRFAPFPKKQTFIQAGLQPNYLLVATSQSESSKISANISNLLNSFQLMGSVGIGIQKPNLVGLLLKANYSLTNVVKYDADMPATESTKALGINFCFFVYLR